MIRIHDIDNIDELFKLGFNSCSIRWEELRKNNEYTPETIKKLTSFFTAYPIDEIIKANIKKQIEIITYIEDPAKNMLNVILSSTLKKDEKKKVKYELYRALEDIFITNGFDKLDKLDKLEYIKKRGTIVCPYCNRNYITPIKNKALGIPIEHFYPQCLYPFFAMTIYNLIPACPTCNSGLKVTKDPRKKGLINPHSMDTDKTKFTFEITSPAIVNLTPDKDSLKICVDTDYSGNKEVFEWENIYDLHRDYIAELIVKQKVLLNSNYEESLRHLLGDSYNDDDIHRYILNVYTNSEEHHKRPLSKFITDIAKELGIIKDVHT
jgi:uncharacterized protein YbaR (Trm112 family)